VTNRCPVLTTVGRTVVEMEPSVLEPRLASGWRPRAFAAIDFETANRSPLSACALSVVRVEGRRIAKKTVSLIRPPTSRFEFTHIHGIAWAHVAAKRAFGEVWESLAPMIEGAEFLAAHNARFDRDALVACCRNARLAHARRPDGSGLGLGQPGDSIPRSERVPASRSTPVQNRVSAILYCSLRPQPPPHITTEGVDHVRAATS